MNIQPVKSDGIVPPAKAKAQPAKSAPATAAADVFKPEQNEKLLSALQAEPDVRPEVLERARALVTDPTYPSNDILAKVADNLLGGTDSRD